MLTTLQPDQWTPDSDVHGGDAATLTAPIAALEAEAQACLARRLKAREPGAFEELAQSMGGRMFCVARRLLRCEQDAEDAVQDAFAGAVRCIDQFDGNALLSTWLHRITVNACLMKLRRMGRRPARLLGDVPPEALNDLPVEPPFRAGGEDADSELLREEVCDLVRSNIATLPEPFRVILILRDVEGLSTEEAAHALDISAAAAKTRLHRARQLLRDLLEPVLFSGAML